MKITGLKAITHKLLLLANLLILSTCGEAVLLVPSSVIQAEPRCSLNYEEATANIEADDDKSVLAEGGGLALLANNPLPRSSAIAACPGSSLEQQLLIAMSRASRPVRDGPLKLGCGAEMRWYTPAEACDLLSTPRPMSLVFVGDSLMRHAMQGIHVLLRQDAELGGLERELPHSVAENCTCDNQFYKPCRSWVKYDTKPGEGACPVPSVTFIGAFDDQYPKRATRLAQLMAREVAAGRNVVTLLGGWGMHNGLKAMPIFADLVSPVWRELHRIMSAKQLQKRLGRAKLLCIGLSAVQDNLPEQYQTTQNNVNVLAFNRQMRTLCSMHGIPFLDVFAATAEATSFDGVHYALRVNLLRAQMLLGYLAVADWDQGEGKTPLPLPS